MGYSFVGITSDGVEIPIQLPVNNESSNSTATGDSILDGLGVYMVIENVNTNGKVYFGENSGKQTDIRQYVGIGENDNWAIAITDEDNYETMSAPEFGKEYQYDSGSLIDVTTSEPNILGYSGDRVLTGNVNVSIDNEGLIFSGDGEMVLELHDYSNQSIFLRGLVDTNNKLSLITSDTNLINAAYESGKGYLTYSGNIDPGTNSISVLAGIDSTHTGVQTYTAYGTDKANGNRSGDIFCRGKSTNFGAIQTGELERGDRRGHYICNYSTSASIPVSLVKTNDATHFTITGDDTTPQLLDLPSCGSQWFPCMTAQTNSNFNFKVYDTLPSTRIISIEDSSFEQVIPFTADSTYIYVELNGGNITIKGEVFDPNSDVFFKVTNLPIDTAFDVSKSGITGVVGKSSEIGEISLLLDDVDFGVTANPGGILKIYPNSTKYMGDFGIGMIDFLHGFNTELSVGEDLLYIP